MPDQIKSTIGVALIARNAENSIRACIRSFCDHVDDIVVVLAGESTDHTRREAKRASPKVRLFDFEWCMDFSAARNFSFSKLNTDWILWVDADDEVVGADKLPILAANADKNVGAIWFPYHYACDEFGNLTTLYERERLLRSSLQWVWQSRIHETVSSLQPCTYVRYSDVIIKHNHLAGADRSPRNMELLNIMYREEEGNRRVWLYMGHQSFAMRNWPEAVKWYRRFGYDSHVIPLEKYQALCYSSKANREIHDVTSSMADAMAAIELFPQYRDAYYEVATCYFLVGEYDKTLFYANLSRQKDIIQAPPSIIFINPLEYTFGVEALMGDASLSKNDYPAALKYYQSAHAIRPTEQIKERITALEDQSHKEEMARGIKMLALSLLNSGERLKLKQFVSSLPCWFTDTPDYRELAAGAAHHCKVLEERPSLVGTPLVLTDYADTTKILETYDESLQKDGGKATVIAKYPGKVKVFSSAEFETALTSRPGRRIVNLQRENGRQTAEYELGEAQKVMRMFLGQGLEYWSPKTAAENGIGGSELAAMQICKGFTKHDFLPILYAMDDQVWERVIYRRFDQFKPEYPPCHLFVSSRIPDVFTVDIPAEQKWLWMHDVDCGNRLTPEITDKLDAIIVLSQWHVNHVKKTYPWLADAQVLDYENNPLTYTDAPESPVYYQDAKGVRLPVLAIIGNGLIAENFEEQVEKEPFTLVWNSSPDRGLKELLELWPLLKKKEPRLKLKIHYGWNYFDARLGDPAYRAYKAKIQELIAQDGITWVGRLGQKALAKATMAAHAMVYPPHEFRETYGIAFLEAQACQTLVIYRQNGALGETVGDRGVPIPMKASQEEIADITISALSQNGKYATLLEEGKRYALAHSWQQQADKMGQLYEVTENAKNRHIEGDSPKS